MLDGENAWEHYPDNACDFFTALYAGVAAERASRPRHLRATSPNTAPRPRRLLHT